MATKPFVSDIENIRKRARQHMQRGAVTAGYKADRETVVKILNEALATEIVCVLRYKHHHYMASGIHAQSVAAEFLEHANEEQLHADQIAERIAIDSYREIVEYLGNDDITTRRIMEQILAKEEEHAEDLKTLLEELGKKGEPAAESLKKAEGKKAEMRH